ncbi:MAG: hypothetical protein WCS42_20060 [Verrucomicrobiota bacterium]
MAEAKQVVAALDAVNKAPAAPTVSEPVAPKKVTVFWKTMNPFEKIVFPDKTELVFGRQTFATADEALTKKLLSVASRYGIIPQP